MPPRGQDEVKPWSERVRWMGQPAFFVCIAALVLNDHVLKEQFPGWWTGKLSDFAGLAVIGIALAAVIGLRRGLAVAGVAFGLLKLVPGVAEAAAPLLGGVTRRDPSDLLALTVLLPIWLVLRPRRSPTVVPSPSGKPQPRGIWVGVRTTLATVAPIVGMVCTAAATTATSCGPHPAVVMVMAQGQDLYALVATGVASERWAISEDGGHTWHGTEPPSTGSKPRTAEDAYHDPGPTGPQEACAPDGTCWRLRARRSIERVAPDGAAVEEFRLTEREFSNISTGCAGGSIGVLASITTTDRDGDVGVLASLGADGALVRQEDGSWESVRVLSAPPVEASGAETAAARALLFFGPVLALVLWLVGRRRWPSWRTGLPVTGVGWAATISASGAIDFVAGPGTDGARMHVWVIVPGTILTSVAAVVVARRPARTRPLSSYPPPPPPPPAMPEEGDEGA